MDIPFKPGIELVIGIAIWVLGRRLWGIRFTRQWYDDVLKEQKYVQSLVETADRNEPMKEFIRRLDSRSPGTDSGENEATKHFHSKIEENLSETRHSFESRWQLLFALTFILVLGSLALSPYVMAVNLCVALFLSRFAGLSNSNFRVKVFSDALLARLPAVELIMGWFKSDPNACCEWCTVSHPEFQEVFAVVSSSALHVDKR
jgi:hypothetical protein